MASEVFINQFKDVLLMIVVDNKCLADYNRPSYADGTSISALMGHWYFRRPALIVADYSEKQWLLEKQQ